MLYFQRLVLLTTSVALMLAAGGCANIRNTGVLGKGPGVEFAAEEVAQFTDRQTQVLAELKKAAGSDNDWDLIIAAGTDYADRQCEEYLHALFRLDRDRRTSVAQVGLFGTAVAGVFSNPGMSLKRA